MARRIDRLSVCFVLGLALALAALASAAEKIDHEALGTYKKLSWEDFRGPDMRGQQVAWLASTIVVDPYDTEVSEQAGGGYGARMKFVDVYAIMDKLQSGARRGMRDEWNLVHEQVHFDIAEIHARRLHAHLTELVVAADEDAPLLQVLFDQAVQLAWESERQSMNQHQARYDGETVHGSKKSRQKKWVELVAGELAAEEPYPLK